MKNNKVEGAESSKFCSIVFDDEKNDNNDTEGCRRLWFKDCNGQRLVVLNFADEEFESVEEAVYDFECMLHYFNHPSEVFDNPNDECSRFEISSLLLASAFQAANKAFEEYGNTKKQIVEVLKKLFAYPEIVRAIDDFTKMPESIANGYFESVKAGSVDKYAKIIDSFIEGHESELEEEIRTSFGSEKTALEDELKKCRFEMFPIEFNGKAKCAFCGFKKFAYTAKIAKTCFWCFDEKTLGHSPVYGKDWAVGDDLFSCARSISFYAPDNVPLRGGGGCECVSNSLDRFSEMLKSNFGIEDRKEQDQVSVPVPDKPVSEYAARYVRNYQASPVERFTFMMDDGKQIDIDLENVPLKYCKFLKRLMSESRTNNQGWVIMSKPEWLKNRKDVCKLVSDIFACLEYRREDGRESFRITGKRQEWTRGPECKKFGV